MKHFLDGLKYVVGYYAFAALAKGELNHKHAKRIYERILFVWAIACAVLKLWDSPIIHVLVYLLGFLFFVSLGVSFYTSWRETKNIGLMLKQNTEGLILLLLVVGIILL